MKDLRNFRAVETLGDIQGEWWLCGSSRGIRRSEGVPRAPGHAKVCPGGGGGGGAAEWEASLGGRVVRGISRHWEGMWEVGAARRPWIPAPSPGAPPPAALGFLGSERRLRRGAVRPRWSRLVPAPPRRAPTHIAPRPRPRRAPLPGPAAAAAARPELRPPHPAPRPRGRRSPAAPTRRCGRADPIGGDRRAA